MIERWKLHFDEHLNGTKSVCTDTGIKATNETTSVQQSTTTTTWMVERRERKG